MGILGKLLYKVATTGESVTLSPAERKQFMTELSDGVQQKLAELHKERLRRLQAAAGVVVD